MKECDCHNCDPVQDHSIGCCCLAACGSEPDFWFIFIFIAKLKVIIAAKSNVLWSFMTAKAKAKQLQQTLNAGNHHHLKTDNWKIFHSDKKAAIFSEGQSSLIATNEWKSSCHYFFRLLMLWTKSIFRSWLNHSTLHFHLDLSLSLSQSEAATKTFSKKWILTFLALASPQVIRCSNKHCLRCLTVLCLRSKF